MIEAVYVALGVGFAAIAVYLTVRLVNRRESWVAGVAAIVVWHAVCLAVLSVYRPTIGRVVVAVYAAFCGDIQSSYVTFARIGQYFGLTTTTAMATAITLWFFEALTRRRSTWRRRAIVFASWETVAVAVLIWSYEVGFPYKINELEWAIFGPPDDLYGFRNMVLHRVIAWLICTTPIASAGVLLDGWLAGPDSPGPRPKGDGSGG